MSKSTAQILWFDQISKHDIAIAGGKGANLGEMTSAGIPVPNGFVVTAKAYYDFLAKTSLKHKILTELSGLDYNDSAKLFAASKRIKTAIMAAELPGELAEEIKEYYHQLSGEHDRLVAVRSSATAEDLPDASFAGQQETYLNIKSWQAVVHCVQKCWASLFESRAIFYRSDRGFSHFKIGIAVPVQLMVQSEVSGIMFTVNPLTNNRGEVSIEAAWGLGQPVVSGELTPDQYLVDKKTKKVVYKHLAKQTWQMTLAGNIKVARDHQEVQKLSDAKIKELADIGMHIEKHYGHPQDIEWGMEGRKLYIVQSRPVTTLKQANVSEETGSIDSTKQLKVLFSGLPASPGIASGPVSIVKTPKELGIVTQGSVLVAEMTNPDYVPAMRKACAIVTDSGGKTSHAAIVSRELGVPAVVGSGVATKTLKDGQIISVDGTNGKIYEGNVV
ncbi:MAG: PEP/pyruvate-binding domain-containing protein, partial [bacterium]